MDYEAEWKVLVDTIRAAGAEVMRRYQSFEKIEDAPADISTEADRASQDLIFASLSEHFPNDRLCGEERTESLERELANEKSSSRMWIVDPIDGTRGFARKNGEFSIMVGLVQAGEPILGAVFEPVIDRLTMANRSADMCVVDTGRTTWTTASTRRTEKLSEAVVAMSRSRKPDAERRLLEIFGAPTGIKSYSAGIKLAQVARGDADLYVGDYPVMHDWDICAGAILVEVAGGRVTDFEGQPLRFGEPPFKQSKGLLATSGAIHDAALEIIRTNPPGLY